MMKKQSLSPNPFAWVDAKFSRGTIDIADRLCGYLVLAGMMVWSVSRLVPEEYLWNIQAGHSFTRFL